MGAGRVVNVVFWPLGRSRWIVFAVLALIAAACAADEAPYVERPVEQLYNEAMDSLLEGNYGTAALSFDEVERQHPYSIWATRAQLMTSFAYYQANRYDDAILAAERFVQLHPGFDTVD